MEKRLYARRRLDLKLIIKIYDPCQADTPIYFSAQSINVSAGGMLIQSRGLSIPAYQYLLAKGHIHLLYHNPVTKNIDMLASTITRFDRQPDTANAATTCTIGISFAQKQEIFNKSLDLSLAN
jgi:hypothetical protein